MVAQLRHHRVANEVAWNGPIEIGRILAPRFLDTAQEILQLRAGRIEKRSHQVVAPRRHRSEPAAARAANQPEYHGLRLIVACMRDRHAVGLDRRQRLAKKALPRKATGDFDRDAVLAGFARDVRIAGDRGNTQTIRERAAKRRVGVRFRASNLMVEMRESCENEFTARRQVAQQEGEGDRIRTA